MVTKMSHSCVSFVFLLLHWRGAQCETLSMDDGGRLIHDDKVHLMRHAVPREALVESGGLISQSSLSHLTGNQPSSPIHPAQAPTKPKAGAEVQIDGGGRVHLDDKGLMRHAARSESLLESKGLMRKRSLAGSHHSSKGLESNPSIFRELAARSKALPEVKGLMRKNSRAGVHDHNHLASVDVDQIAALPMTGAEFRTAGGGRMQLDGKGFEEHAASEASLESKGLMRKRSHANSHHHQPNPSTFHQHSARSEALPESKLLMRKNSRAGHNHLLPIEAAQHAALSRADAAAQIAGGENLHHDAKGLMRKRSLANSHRLQPRSPIYPQPARPKPVQLEPGDAQSLQQHNNTVTAERVGGNKLLKLIILVAVLLVVAVCSLVHMHTVFLGNDAAVAEMRITTPANKATKHAKKKIENAEDTTTDADDNMETADDEAEDSMSCATSQTAKDELVAAHITGPHKTVTPGSWIADNITSVDQVEMLVDDAEKSTSRP